MKSVTFRRSDAMYLSTMTVPTSTSEISIKKYRFNSDSIEEIKVRSSIDFCVVVSFVACGVLVFSMNSSPL